MSDDRYTRIGASVHDWEPLIRCTITARYLWMVIYTCGETKNSVPGMCRASIRGLAEIAHMRADDCIDAMDNLVEHGLVEYDQERRIIRLTQLPDRGDRATAGNHIRGWWTKFRALPDCAIRNAHVEVLRWLCDGGSADLQIAWGQTFQAIQPPAKRRRGRQRFDSDTGTESQPSLFCAQPVPETDIPASEPAPTVVVAEAPVDNSGLVHASSQASPVTDTPVCVFPDTYGSHPGSPSNGPGRGRGMGMGSGSDLSGSGSAAQVERVEQIPVASVTPIRPHLNSLPLATDLTPALAYPFTVTEMLEAISCESGGRFAAGPVDGRLQNALCATISSCADSQVVLEDLRTTGKWLASGGLGFRTDLGPRWASMPGNLLDAVGQARRWLTSGGATSSVPRSTRRAEPAPRSAFGSGVRAL